MTIKLTEDDIIERTEKSIYGDLKYKDYVVSVKLPNNRKMTILIPTDIEPGERPYGLNLVFGGHYE